MAGLDSVWRRARANGLVGPRAGLARPCSRLRSGYGGCGPCCAMHARIHHGGRHVDMVHGQWPCSDGNWRPPVIDGRVQLTVLHGLRAVLYLRGQRPYVLFAHRVELALGRPNVQAAAAAVVADTVHVVHDHRVVIDVGDVGHVDVID